MAIIYKADILAKLKQNGITTYQLRKEKILSEKAIQLIREGKPVSWQNLGKICALLKCQPGDLLEWVDADELEEI
jgi:putative transcriptional regulator